MLRLEHGKYEHRKQPRALQVGNRLSFYLLTVVGEHRGCQGVPGCCGRPEDGPVSVGPLGEHLDRGWFRSWVNPFPDLPYWNVDVLQGTLLAPEN